MGIANDINRHFTMAVTRFGARELEGRTEAKTGTYGYQGPVARMPWRGEARPPTGRARLAINRAVAPESETRAFLTACVLELQGGMYRVFAAATGALLHSHEFKFEAIRRAERDGYHFIHAPA